jgi:glycine/D-amino acid oxidase-like deaminating enzyme
MAPGCGIAYVGPMAQLSSQSVLIVGGGITGLTLAVVLQASRHRVTLIARDAPADTASGVAAGMVAPALEAMNDPDPALSYQRLKVAQQAWLDLFGLWSDGLRQLITDARAESTRFVWNDPRADMDARLSTTGAGLTAIPADELHKAGFDPVAWQAVAVEGDWLMEASVVLKALQDQFVQQGGRLVIAPVSAVAANTVTLADGSSLQAASVVLAAGYGAKAFAGSVPVLEVLTPIKGHLLDVTGQDRGGVLRATSGYLADYGRTAKFGATMQAGQDDLVVEPDVVADLKRRAAGMDRVIAGVSPRTGVRASTPDEWPLIGRDPSSGVLVATGMRRNGYIFAPLAAQIILALIEGRESPDGEIYRPDRFVSRQN